MMFCHRAKPPSVDPEPSAIAAVQRAADFMPVDGGFVRLLRDALQAQPGMYRAALCGALYEIAHFAMARTTPRSHTVHFVGLQYT